MKRPAGALKIAVSAACEECLQLRDSGSFVRVITLIIRAFEVPRMLNAEVRPGVRFDSVEEKERRIPSFSRFSTANRANRMLRLNS